GSVVAGGPDPGGGSVAFGSFPSASASEGSVLVVPSTIIGRRGGRSWLITIPPAGTPVPALAEVPSPTAPDALTGPAELRWHDGGLSAPDWERAVAPAVARIQARHLRKGVLARDLDPPARD